jgi:hypothetical protein
MEKWFYIEIWGDMAKTGERGEGGGVWDGGRSTGGSATRIVPHLPGFILVRA